MRKSKRLKRIRFWSHVRAVLTIALSFALLIFFVGTVFPNIMPGVYRIPMARTVVGLSVWSFIAMMIVAEPFVARGFRLGLVAKARWGNATPTKR